MATTSATAPATYPTKGKASSRPTGWLPFFLGTKGPTGYGSTSTTEEVAANWNGEGKVVIITGADSGVGAESARVLSGRGAEVIMAVRNLPKGETGREDIRKYYPNAKLTIIECDLASLGSIKTFCKAFLATGKPLHVLMCNAGVMAPQFSKTKEGFEYQFGTNSLGHFFLTKLLLPKMIETAKASGFEGRIVVLSSMMHWTAYPEGVRFDCLDNDRDYGRWRAYGQSKLCNLLFARELALRLEGEPVAVAACHPGTVNTEIGRHTPLPKPVQNLLYLVFSPGIKRVKTGAATQVYLATATHIERGEFYSDCNISDSSPQSLDANLGRKLWEKSEELVAPFL